MNPHPLPETPEDDNDDALIGTVLSRRKALRLFGLAGGASLLGGAALAAGLARPPGPPSGGPMGSSAGKSGVTGLPGCVVRPEQTQGPYWVDEKLRRADIRSDSTSKSVQAGVPLTLRFVISRVALHSCAPRAGVMVDVWQANAVGVYSDAHDPGYDTRGQNFLRGYQLTDSSGVASFQTIYPGWYAGRAVHIHYRLRTLQGSSVTGEFTSQLFFPEALTDTVHASAAYSARGKRDTLNAQDSVYKNGGSQMLLKPVGSVDKGYSVTFDVGLNI